MPVFRIERTRDYISVSSWMKSVGWEKHRLLLSWMRCYPGTRH